MSTLSAASVNGIFLPRLRRPHRSPSARGGRPDPTGLPGGRAAGGAARTPGSKGARYRLETETARRRKGERKHLAGTGRPPPPPGFFARPPPTTRRPPAPITSGRLHGSAAASQRPRFPPGSAARVAFPSVGRNRPIRSTAGRMLASRKRPFRPGDAVRTASIVASGLSPEAVVAVAINHASWRAGASRSGRRQPQAGRQEDPLREPGPFAPERRRSCRRGRRRNRVRRR